MNNIEVFKDLSVETQLKIVQTVHYLKNCFLLDNDSVTDFKNKNDVVKERYTVEVFKDLKKILIDNIAKI